MTSNQDSTQKRLVDSPVLTDKKPGTYLVNEVFYSLQGEGKRAGTPMVFIRFSQCNLRCTVANAGFDCDTEFMSFRQFSIDELVQEAERLNPSKGWMLFTGGEPGLQIDKLLISTMHAQGWKLAVETNGTIKLPTGLDWITVSPKSADHTIRQRTANELKYVRSHGMSIPATSLQAEHYLISPAFQPDGSVRQDDLQWCIDLVKQNPQQWQLNLQYHKFIDIR
ncbi:MAG: 7-carboxy-7-deazaguanine synthase QueE [Oligoflexia bacterium]|nr:7-carboxy-7-deazaguanine synthase QueE [Oligoflexia bacterium]